MHARIGGGQVKLLTRTGLDWSHRYKRTIEALGSLQVKSAYLDGELCALNSDGVPCSAGSRRRWMKAVLIS
jgi:ATP-dependent DNA ligase